MVRLADRLEGFAQSDIRRMSRECERVGGINLGQGICDLPTLPLVADGAIDAIRAGHAVYSKFEGIESLREKIAAKCASFNGYAVDPASEVVVTVGSTGGFAAAAMATLNPGDEVILFEPFYGYHLGTLKLLGVQPRFVPLRGASWAIDFDELAAAFGPRTRGVVVCTPSNPCGKVFTSSELETIGELCRRNGALAYTDEIYEYIVYDGRHHVSMASLESCRDLTVTISGFSKTFSITGWRIGYVTAPVEIARGVGLVNDLLYVCAPTPLQHGVARGLDADESYYRDMATEYQAKRDMLAAALRDAGMIPLVPEGAYYMLADVAALGYPGAREAADALLAGAKVASVPGTAFYASRGGDQLLRFCFAKDFEPLEKACHQIRQFRAVVSSS